MAIRSRNKLVCGVGANDADYVVAEKVNGKLVCCQFYVVWRNMIKRCYNLKFQLSQPAYVGCTVADEWLNFSKFKRWMESQDWKGKQLDKDLISIGNRVYSPEKCVFVDAKINLFVVASLSRKGDFPTGVCFDNKLNKFKASCKNQFTGKVEHLGVFVVASDAHSAWKKRKHELACQLASTQENPRVSEALRTRYL